MLGYKVDFAHPAVVSAMGSSNQNWKAAGYFGASVMMTCPSAATRVEAVLRSDLASTEVAFVLASLQYLSMVPNTAVAFWAEVSSIANPSSNFPPHVRKRAYACMLVCVRDDPSLLPPSQWAPRLAHCFTAEHDVGALLAVCSLLNGAIQASSKGWEGVIPPVINVLLLFSESRVAKSATYRGVLCPWLHAKLLRLLRLFPRNLSRSHLDNIGRVVTSVLDLARAGRYGLVDCIVYLEVVLLVLHYQTRLPSSYRKQSTDVLIQMMGSKNQNVRTTSLVTMRQVEFNREIVRGLKLHLDPLIRLAHERDPLLQLHAVALLVTLSDEDTWRTLVEALIKLLEGPCPHPFQTAVKVMALVETHASGLEEYVDCVFRVCFSLGDQASDEAWMRLVQLLTGFEGERKDLASIRNYAVEKAMRSLNTPRCPVLVVRMSAFILGEFSGQSTVSPDRIVSLLIRYTHAHHGLACTRIIVTALTKIALRGHCRDDVCGLLQCLEDATDSNLQQRASEALGLLREVNASDETPFKFSKDKRVISLPERRKPAAGRTLESLKGLDTTRDDVVIRQLPVHSDSIDWPVLGLSDTKGLWLRAVLHGKGPLFVNAAIVVEAVSCKPLTISLRNVTGQKALRKADHRLVPTSRSTVFALTDMNLLTNISHHTRPDLKAPIDLRPGVQTTLSFQFNLTSLDNFSVPRLQFTAKADTSSFTAEVLLPVCALTLVEQHSVPRKGLQAAWTALPHQEMFAGHPRLPKETHSLLTKFGFDLVPSQKLSWWSGKVLGHEVIMCIDLSKSFVKVALKSYDVLLCKRLAVELSVFLVTPTP